MKKLMLTIAVIAIAAISQGAVMSWASGAIKQPGSTTAATMSNTSVQYFLIAASEYTSIMSAVSSMDGNGVSTYLYDLYNGTTTAASSTTANKGALTTKDSKTYVKDDTVSAVIIYTAKDSEGVENYIANIGQWTFESDSNKSAGSMGLLVTGNLTDDGRSISWQAASSPVPEPFSGALALLGLGAIALRRKMKKAKKA